MKNKDTASAAATLYHSGVITCDLVVLPSWHCDALDPRHCLVGNVRLWLRKTPTAVARPRSEIGQWVLLDKYRAGLQLPSPQVCEMCFVIYLLSRAGEEVMRAYIHVLSRLTALLTWATSPGWTSAETCCNVYKEYHASVVFTLSYVRQFCSSHHHSNCLIWNVTRSEFRNIWMSFFAWLCSILFNMAQYHAYLTPPSTMRVI